jgi:glycine cleavage system aminomethyltransferase T
MTAPAIIAAVVIVGAIGVQGYALWMTAQQVRRVYRPFHWNTFVHAGWPHMVNVVGMLAWTGLLTWGGFWG